MGTGAAMVEAGGRVGAVVAAVRERVAAGALAPGERLPSIRAAARAFRVSPSTVVEAYDRLSAAGLIQARPGSGFYVAGTVPALALASAPRPERAIDPLWVSRQSLDAAGTGPKPGCGWLPADWMPQSALRRALRGLARAEDATLAEYGPARGDPGLRALLARSFAREGLPVSPDQILLTASATAALDLVCRFLLRPGDTILLDDPGYFNFQAIGRAHRADLVGVPYGPDGPDLEAFAAVLAARRPRLYVTNSALHNPTGATPTPAAAHRLLTLAAAYDLTIVEDDAFAEFEPEPSPRLAALDGLARVLRIGTLSKTLSASLRCGWIAGRADWIEGLVDLQVATSFGGASPAAAALVRQILADGSHRRHVLSLHRRLAATRRTALDGLARLGIRPQVEPRGGFYLWCSLPDDLPAASLARAALRDDLVLAPGDVFSLTRSAPTAMRFNAAHLPGPALFDRLARAMDEAARE